MDGQGRPDDHRLTDGQRHPTVCRRACRRAYRRTASCRRTSGRDGRRRRADDRWRGDRRGAAGCHRASCRQRSAGHRRVPRRASCRPTDGCWCAHAGWSCAARKGAFLRRAGRVRQRHADGRHKVSCRRGGRKASCRRRDGRWRRCAAHRASRRRGDHRPDDQRRPGGAPNGACHHKRVQARRLAARKASCRQSCEACRHKNGRRPACRRRDACRRVCRRTRAWGDRWRPDGVRGPGDPRGGRDGRNSWPSCPRGRSNACALRLPHLRGGAA